MNRSQRPRDSRGFLTDLVRAVSWHRRKLAVVAAVAAVLCGVSSARPADPPTAAVVWAGRALTAGHVVTADDLETVRVPRSALPDDPLSDPSLAVGRPLAADVPRHRVLTALDLRSARELSRPGNVVAPVRVADPEVVALIRPGDRVDVLGAEPQGAGRVTVVAAGVRVVAVPRSADADDQSDQGRDTTTLVLLETDRTTATSLAGVAEWRLSVLLR